LLAVDNPQDKQHLARAALQHAWSVDQSQQTIAAEKPQPPHPLVGPNGAGGDPDSAAGGGWRGRIGQSIHVYKLNHSI